MTKKILSRRELLSSSLGLGALAALTGCSKAAPFSCTSVEGLAVEDILPRTKLGYTDVAADSKRACSSCQQFVPAPSGGSGCGGCKIMKGPIHPDGSCRSYQARS